MTLSYWDTQFNFRASLPGFDRYLESMTARSAEVALPFERLPYGSDARQFVEISGQPGPILPVFIHGGYWRALTAEMHRFVLAPLVQRYGAVANLEYRLLPQVSLAEIVEDAVTGLRRLAHETGAGLLVIGHSAGGHLAVMGAQTLPDLVRGAVGVSGLYDLTPLPFTFLKAETGLSAADIAGQSPLAVWNRGPADHVLVAVGAEETAEMHRQAHIFASLHGARFVSMAGAHHMEIQKLALRS